MHKPEVSEGRLWEKGCPGTNTGEVQVICGPSGEKLTPAWADQNRAGFTPVPGMLVVQIERPGGGQEPLAALYRYEGGENFTLMAEGTYQSIEISGELTPALNATMDKAECFHCRCIHWAGEAQRRDVRPSRESRGVAETSSKSYPSHLHGRTQWKGS